MTYALLTPVASALGGSGSRIVIVLLVAVAAGLATVSAFLLFGKGDRNAVGGLDTYNVAGVTQPGASDESQLAGSRLVQQAVDLTGRLATRAGVLGWLENALEQADLPLRPAEALFFYPAGVLLVALFLLLVASTTAIALILTVVVAAVPPIWLSSRKARRKKRFEAQLPDTLQLLAGSMRAGFSFLQGMEAVMNETTEPMRRELNRVMTEARLGRTLEDALDDAAARMDSLDLTWAVMAIRIQREVGGNLAELLDTVADTMQQRDRLRGEIRALTAEGRFSGIILGLFPFAFAAMLAVIAPKFLDAMFEDASGYIVMAIAASLSGFGFLWLQKIMRIEV